jgi:hypothetical protein
VAFARKINAPYFLVCVLKDIRSFTIGTMERAFLIELASKAVAGGRGSGLCNQEASNLALLHGTELGSIREVEARTRDFLLFANRQRRPDMVTKLLNEWVQAKDGWVVETVAFSLCLAAMKGALN